MPEPGDILLTLHKSDDHEENVDFSNLKLTMIDKD